MTAALAALTGVSHILSSVPRTLRIHLRACSKAHKCSEMPIKPMLIVREYVYCGATLWLDVQRQ